jgi:ketosteroid isomerase-like protein
VATEPVTILTLEAILAAFNGHDVESVLEFFADDAVMEMPRGPEPWGTRFSGKEEIGRGVTARFQGMPDVSYSDDRHWVCGDRGSSEWLLKGTTTDGQRVEVRGCDLWEFRDGLVIRKDSYWKIVS